MSECEGCGRRIHRTYYILSGHLYCSSCGRQPWHVINGYEPLCSAPLSAPDEA